MTCLPDRAQSGEKKMRVPMMASTCFCDKPLISLTPKSLFTTQQPQNQDGGDFCGARCAQRSAADPKSASVAQALRM
jgi:hypothetical protein